MDFIAYQLGQREEKKMGRVGRSDRLFAEKRMRRAGLRGLMWGGQIDFSREENEKNNVE